MFMGHTCTATLSLDCTHDAPWTLNTCKGSFICLRAGLPGRWSLNGGAHSIQVLSQRFYTAIVRDLNYQSFKTGGHWMQVVASTGFTLQYEIDYKIDHELLNSTGSFDGLGVLYTCIVGF